ncbi:DNA repair protein [Cylindrobasidium torrendii FP15055 ss-10]|uniref:DNA repair protein REV1 n=1 Tax=Cylindrobasidium torrendii FP15055 ss-10 TaxID=1314674 RepID=A0A0D7AYV5_9AGAR|nr:DNA repair protein [Cylindrobasidium torrendii FP15055 ss-10]
MTTGAISNSQDYFSEEDPSFLDALDDVILPGEEPIIQRVGAGSQDKPNLKRQREDDDEDVYGAAQFGNFAQYMDRKRAKLQIQNAGFGSTGSDIFRGITIYINGWTTPSVQVLREVIVSNGGVFQPYLVNHGLVTHIVTCNLTPAKMREFQNMKVVRPEWLTESVAHGSLLPWTDFIFRPEQHPDKSQGTQATTQKTLSFRQREIPASSSSKSAARDSMSDAEEEEDERPKYAAHKSNPNAQRVMAQSDWRQAHTSANPDFIEGYYKNSRLHHLSTWKAELRNLVQEAQARAENGLASGKVAAEDTESGGVSMRGAEFIMRSPSRSKGKAPASGEERVIMHCDFDCFFVSAGLLKRPEMKGQPVVVCHSQGNQGSGSSTSEIASCSYEARAFNIKNGMSLQQARKLCPGVKTIPYEFELYKELSLKFYTILMSHADDLQAVSVDEALIEVTGTLSRLRLKAKDFAESIRAEVKRDTGCEVSIGIAHNILLARLATRKAKPAKSYYLSEGDAAELVATLDIADLHGFGWSTKQKAVEKLGSSNLGELSKKSRGELCDALGKAMGETVYNAIRGIDHKKLESDKPRKSVSCEINYGIRFIGNDEAEVFVKQMAVEVTKRLNEVGMLGRSITLKIMKRDPEAPVEPPKFMGHGACELFNKQGPLADPSGRATNDDKVIGEHAWRMLKSFNFPPHELRGIGIQIQKLESKHTAVPQGQKTLPFAAIKAPKASVKEAEPDPVKRLCDTARRRANTPVELPTYSQVDQSVYQSLPDDIKEECEQEYKARAQSVEQTDVVNPLMPYFKRSRSRSVQPLFPSRASAEPSTNVKRITSMLAPKRAGTTSPTRRDQDFFGQRARSGKASVLDEELQELGLDPEVFHLLPKSIQQEQLTRARLIDRDVGLPDMSQRVLFKPQDKGVRTSSVPPPSQAQKARYPQPVALKQRGKEKGEKLYFTDADDIMGIIEQWVGRFMNRAPNTKDVEFFRAFLVKSMEAPGGQGVDTAVKVLRWWMMLLRRNWGELEHVEEKDKENIGSIWWTAFREVRAQMDEIALRRLGGKLSLR